MTEKNAPKAEFGPWRSVAHAKCVLSGEHAVLRGHPAVVLPVHNISMTLHYDANHDGQRLSTSDGTSCDHIKTIWQRMMIRATEYLGLPTIAWQGHLMLDNHIRTRSGLGGSAALCVLTAQWLKHLGYQSASDHDNTLSSWATAFEDVFHQRSSGMDVAGVLTNQPILYTKQGGGKLLNCSWKPNLYLTHSGEQSVTANCVKNVAKIRLQLGQCVANRIDATMAEATNMAKVALTDTTERGYRLLCQALETAQSCFKNWELVTPTCARHIDALYRAGADAAKLTGAGAGGYALSLWPSSWNADTIREALEPCTEVIAV